MRKTVFPEAANLKFPLGTLAQVKETARQDRTTAAEYTRRAVRSELAGEPARDEGQIIEVCSLAGELSLVGTYEVARLTRDRFSIIKGAELSKQESL